MVRLYSAGTDLDVGEFSTTLTFSIADIREPDKRNAAFSKTLTLPGTKANNLFFENMFEVDVVTQTFNPNLKALTVLSIDGVTQFKGALKLRQVNYLLGGEVTYDCNLIGTLSDFIQSLGNTMLRDLDLSAYNHVFNQANMEASWTPTIGTGYVYPMINYGYQADLNQWDMGNFRPAPFAKTIMDAIFSSVGYSYLSSFFTSTIFKSLIIPNSNDALRLTGTQVNGRLFNAGRTTPQNTTHSFSGNNNGETETITIQINNDSTLPYFDNDASFNTGNYSHEPNYNGTNNYTCELSVEFTISVYGSFSPNAISVNGCLNIVRDGFLLNSQALLIGYTTVPDDGAPYSYTFNATFAIAAESIVVGSFNSIYVKLDINVATAELFSVSSSSSSITGISFKNVVANDVIQIGDTVVLSNSLPDMLQKDFVMGIVKMFNLYLEQDANDETLLNIEPRNDYYTTTQVDWTAKLATEKKLEIEPMAFLNFKRILASYKPDDDYYNKLYKSEFARVYGDYKADINNDFVSGDYKIETNFAPTPLQGNYDNDRIIPAMFEGSGEPPVVEPTTGIPRILYWGGLKNCEPWDFRYFTQHNWKTQYPYAGHLDDPQNPTIDLSFGVPLKVFYGLNQFIDTLTYTDNNLYSEYYSQMIGEITDRDSKMVTGYFWLKPTDILSLDFKKIYRVGSHALRLNKICDYNPVKPTITKVEFIKIKDTASFASSSAEINGGAEILIGSFQHAPLINTGGLVSIDGNVVGRHSSTVITGEKNFAGGGLSTEIRGARNRVHGRDSSGVVIVGEDNTVQAAASGVVIHGYQNTVGFGAKNIFIQGERNIINPGLSDVTLIHSHGITVTENNTLYIDSIRRYSDTVYERETGWTYSNSKNLNSSPIPIPEIVAKANKLILVSEVLFCVDAGGTPFNFANDLELRYTGGNTIMRIPLAIVNSATDYFYQDLDITSSVGVGQGIELYTAVDAPAGNGVYYIKCIYQVIDKPF